MHDLIVIGGGPAGYRAAEMAGVKGLKTLLIEKGEVGGVCLNEGCIPTKTYLYSAKLRDNAANGKKYGIAVEGVQLDHPTILMRKNKVVKTLVGGVKRQLKQAGVEMVLKEASIAGRTAEGFEIRCNDTLYTGKRLLIATGSVPVIPPIPGLKEALKDGIAVTNRELLDAKTVPKRLTVIGGGVIGLEMAGYFSSAGSKVTVIEMLDHIGGNIDTDIAKILQKNLEKKGIRILTGCKVTAVKQNRVVYEDASGKNETECDLVLLSVGRRAATEGIGLENVGVQLENGAVKTDEKMKTNIPEIYAAGDVNGRSMLAHTAYREAEVAVNNMAGETDAMRYNAIPNVIYTAPEVAGAGETEASAKDKGLDFTVKKISMRFAGRYVAENEGGDGIAKIIADNRNKRVIGFHMIGGYASEIIYGTCMMIDREMPLKQLEKIVFPHPTVSEIVKENIFQISESV